MKATELMCGDLILVDGRPTRVYGIMERMGRAYDTMTNDISLKRCEPIPLTREILQKNGWRSEFDKKEYMVFYDVDSDDKRWLMWCIEEKNLDIQRQNKALLERNWCAIRVCITCDYVHELQHALRMIGINKEIRL